jgi:hypothetical protein
VLLALAAGYSSERGAYVDRPKREIRAGEDAVVAVL